MHDPEVTEARSHRSRWRVTGAVSTCACPRKDEDSYEVGFPVVVTPSVRRCSETSTLPEPFPSFADDRLRRGLQTRVRILVDSEIVLSTRYGKTRVFINKTLSTQTAYQQDLINRDLLSTRLIVGKVGPGMRCGKFNSTSNVLVCETQRKVNMYGYVSE